MRLRRRGETRTAHILDDQALLRRTGRIAALQAALALGVVLALVGAVAYFLDGQAQDREISSQLSAVVASADDVTDAPPGIALAIRAPSGAVAVSDRAPEVTRRLLDGSAGYSDVHARGVEYRALVADRAGHRVAALLDLTPWRTGRQRLLLALVMAEVAGAAGAAGVVVMLSRRSIRPLATALALQRRFVADASHELRAPLTVLHTRAQLLARRADKQDVDEGLRGQLHGLVADTRALGDVVEDLLIAASLESDSQDRDRVDLLGLCEEVRDSAVAHAESLGVGLDVEPGEASDVAVTGSRSALRRALVALVDNALGHERPGGRVLLRLGRDAATVSVAVTDTGVGLDPSVAQSLFTRFAHGDGHTAGVRHYGIGLALVQEIVDAHHGHITVEGAPDRGATFTLHLPAADPAR
ncbi:MAG: sensor histidine kinase [Mycobacteriaceae bacterium]